MPTRCLLAHHHLQIAHMMPVSIAFKWTYSAGVFSEPKSGYKVNVLHL